MSMDLDLRSTLRSLARSPGYLATVVASLALGIGAAAAAFGVVDAVRLRALPFPDANRLVVLWEHPAKADCASGCDISYETYANLLQAHPPGALDALAAFTAGGKTLGTTGEPLLVLGGIASPNLFALLHVRPALGRGFSEADDRLGVPLVTVLSHALWTSQFGADPAIVGKTIKLSDSHYTVIGVMPAGFDFELRSQFWLPVVPTLDPSTRPSIRSVNLIGRLAPGRTLAQLNAELAALDPALLARGPASEAGGALRVSAAPLRSRYADSTRSHDLIFAGIVACVLLIACANVANLVLVRTLHQLRELAVRSALGARAGRLARGLLAQHALVVLLATLAGLGFAAWFLHLLQSLEALRSLRPSGMDYRLDARVIGFALLLALGIAGLLGLVSARVVARGQLHTLLREGAKGGGRRANLVQRGFVVVQIAAAVALLTGAGLLTKTAFRLAGQDPGFLAGPVVDASPSYPHPWRVKEKYLPVTRQILAELAGFQGVGSAALRAPTPLGRAQPSGTPRMVVDGRELDPAATPRGGISVSPGYFGALGIAVLAGREFSESDLEGSPPVAIVNQWAAQHWWPGGSPLGATIQIDTAPALPLRLTVVGVVRDNKAAARNFLLSEPGPELYRPYEQASSAFPEFLLKMRSAPGAALRPVRQLLAQRVPDRPVFASLLSEQVADQLGGLQLTAVQIMAFALVGLGLALLGIHGVLSYMVGRRTHEIGVRGALGASRGSIERLVLRDAGRLTALVSRSVCPRRSSPRGCCGVCSTAPAGPIRRCTSRSERW
jgi:predicted permease